MSAKWLSIEIDHQDARNCRRIDIAIVVNYVVGATEQSLRACR